MGRVAVKLPSIKKSASSSPIDAKPSLKKSVKKSSKLNVTVMGIDENRVPNKDMTARADTFDKDGTMAPIQLQPYLVLNDGRKRDSFMELILPKGYPFDIVGLRSVDNATGNSSAKIKRKTKPKKANSTITSIKTYKCNICPAELITQKELKMHLEMHEGRRPFPCVRCSWAFTDPIHLLEHSVKHTQEFPFVCGLCNKKYKTQRGFEKHCVSVHGDDKGSDNDS